MASFSQSLQHHPNIHVDSVFMAKNNVMPGLLVDQQEGSNNNSSMMINNCFSQFYYPIISDPHGIQVIDMISSSGNIMNNNTSSIIAKTSCDVSSDHENEPSSVTKKNSTDQSSTIVDKLESGDDHEQVTQKLPKTISPTQKKRKTRNGASSNSAQSKDTPRGKSRGGNKKQNNSGEKDESETVKKVKVNSKNDDETKKGHEEPPTGYIHVRARRGQATDSHSLAERVRRERISERMKMLQRLVPGCEKVTGKALMLDEIINYVQSLQNQVEFLSMKLASLNPMFYDFGMDIDTFAVRPEGLNTLASQIPSMPQCSQANNNNNYQNIMDNSTALILQQGQRPNTFSHDNVSLLWDMEDQRQSFLNPPGFNNLCSFN